MQHTDTPSLIPIAFAASGSKRAVPTLAADVVAANQPSLEMGFPTVTMIPKAAGGIPPAGPDMNGALNLLSAANRWNQAGGMYPYNAAFSTAIGGYPKGAALLSSDGVTIWQSTTENNVTNPDGGGAAGWRRLDGKDDLASTAAGKGASLVGVQATYSDATAQTVEAILSALAARIGKLGYLPEMYAGATMAAKIQAAHDAAAAAGGGRVVLSGQTYSMASGLTWDMAKVSLDGNGSLLDFSGAGSVVRAFTLTSSTHGDPSISQVRNSAHSLQNFWVKGPGAATTATCFYVSDPAATNPSFSGFTIRQGGAYNWYKGVYLGHGAFCFSLQDWSFNSSAQFGPTDRVAIGIHVATGTNAGERINLENVFCAAADLCIWMQQANGSVQCYNCSFDYSDKMFVIESGAVTMYGGHLENNRDLGYWGDVGPDTNACLTLIGTELVFSAAKPTTSSYELFRSQDSVGHGGVRLVDVRLITGANLYAPQHLISGDGPATCRGMRIQRDTGSMNFIPTTSRSASLWPYGGQFESANWANGVALSGTYPPTRDTSGNSRTGTGCLKFATLTSVAGVAAVTVPCKPGDNIAASFWGKWTLSGTGATMFATLSFVDAGGQDLAISSYTSTTDQGAYGLVRLGNTYPCPQGCTAAKLTISQFGRTSGSPVAYIDDIGFNVQ